MNPHHYAQTCQGQATQGGALSHAQEIVDEAVEVGIEVLAIMDHNNVDGIAVFRSASLDRPAHIFPGFELSTSEGVHLMRRHKGTEPELVEEDDRFMVRLWKQSQHL